MGTSNFLLLGLLENPNLPALSSFPVSVGLAGEASEGRRGNGERERASLDKELSTPWLRCEARAVALKAKLLVRGSFTIVCAPGKRKDLGDHVVS